MTSSGGTEDMDVVRRNIASLIDDTSKTTDGLAKELIVAYERESKLLGGIRKREKEIARLKTKLATRDAQLKLVNERLERMLGTKMMKVQRAYWRMRRPTGAPTAKPQGANS